MYILINANVTETTGKAKYLPLSMDFSVIQFPFSNCPRNRKSSKFSLICMILICSPT